MPVKLTPGMLGICGMGGRLGMLGMPGSGPLAFPKAPGAVAPATMPGAVPPAFAMIGAAPAALVFGVNAPEGVERPFCTAPVLGGAVTGEVITCAVAAGGMPASGSRTMCRLIVMFKPSRISASTRLRRLAIGASISSPGPKSYR